jgi:hypothetical protein
MNRQTIAVTAFAASVFALAIPGCNSGLFRQRDYLGRTVTQQELREIGAVDLIKQSKKPPVSVEQAAASAVQEIVKPSEPQRCTATLT